jgi:hypothetical protein
MWSMQWFWWNQLELQFDKACGGQLFRKTFVPPDTNRGAICPFCLMKETCAEWGVQLSATSVLQDHSQEWEGKTKRWISPLFQWHGSPCQGATLFCLYPWVLWRSFSQNEESKESWEYSTVGCHPKLVSSSLAGSPVTWTAGEVWRARLQGTLGYWLLSAHPCPRLAWHASTSLGNRVGISPLPGTVHSGVVLRQEPWEEEDVHGRHFLRPAMGNKGSRRWHLPYLFNFIVFCS